MTLKWLRRVALPALVLVVSGKAALAESVSFKDPTGDDNGPGGYRYPTDAIYKKGSFDLTGLDVKQKGDRVDLEVGLNSTLEDPWKMGTGFALQMIFVFIDTDHKTGSGNTKGLPGLHVAFAPEDAWDKVVILSPQGPSRVKAEVESKAASLASCIVIPTRVKGAGRTISASVSLASLGGGDPATWGYQVVVQSNEGFPAAGDLLTRTVNEYEGQHRFGGGNDGDCDPHVLDLLAGSGTGDASEVEAQHQMLKYECGADGAPVSMATLKMVRK